MTRGTRTCGGDDEEDELVVLPRRCTRQLCRVGHLDDHDWANLSVSSAGILVHAASSPLEYGSMPSSPLTPGLLDFLLLEHDATDFYPTSHVSPSADLRSMF